MPDRLACAVHSTHHHWRGWIRGQVKDLHLALCCRYYHVGSRHIHRVAALCKLCSSDRLLLSQVPELKERII